MVKVRVRVRSRKRSANVRVLTKKKKRNPKSTRSPSTTTGLAAAMRWEALLRDPCSGDFAYPCYAGSDTGYLVRTVDILAPPAVTIPTGVIGTTTSLNMAFQFTPLNLSASTGVSLITSIASATAFINPTTSGITNFITATSSPVRRYRPVACCLKWIPSGPLMARAGVVGMGYSSGILMQTGQNVTVASLLSECGLRSGNGDRVHEVRWMPTNVDENFTDIGAASLPSAGTVLLVLMGVDGIYDTVNSAVYNGRIELTTVWEWIPQAQTNLSLAPRAPNPYTSQQVLSTITNMGAWLFDGIRSAVNTAGTIQDMVQTTQRFAVSGIHSTVYNGPRLLT